MDHRKNPKERECKKILDEGKPGRDGDSQAITREEGDGIIGGLH